MNQFDTAVLTGIVNTLAALRSDDGASYPYGSKQRWVINIAKQDNILLVDLPAFLGRVPSRSERNKAPDTYRRLEAAGMLHRLHHAHGDRTVQLRVLPAGIAAVAELLEAVALSQPGTVEPANVSVASADQQPAEGPVNATEGGTNGS